MEVAKKLIILAAMTLSGTAFATNYSSWANYRNITLNTATLTTTTITNIPVLVRFSAASQSDLFTGATAALASGADLRVTKADGTTDLPFEIDTWITGAAGSGALWVLLDTVQANSATAYSFRIYWNKAGATTASNSSAVFSPSNGFMAVYHFNQTAGNPLVDATGNATVATPGSGAAPTDDSTSLIGVGKNFNGTSQYYSVGSDSTALNLNSDYGPYTITAWVNPTACPSARMAVLSKYANNNNPGTRQYVLQTGPTVTNWRMTDDPSTLSTVNSNNEYVADATGSCVVGNWTYLAGTYYSASAPTANSAGAANTALYVNGGTAVTGVTASQATGSSIGHSAQAFIGRLNDSSTPRFLAGAIDELTVSNVVRSADWINLSYHTQAAASTAITLGATVSNNANAPSIVTSPASQSKIVGSAVNFAVVATGTTPLVYDWLHSHGGITDTLKRDTLSALTDTLKLTNVPLADTGSFSVVVSNSSGSISSASAKLTLTAPPGIVTSPLSQAITLGSSVNFIVVATGTTPLVYDWLHSHGGITDTLKHDTLSALTDTLKLTNVPLADTGSFSVVVINSAGNATSGSATLTLTAGPSIISSPASATVILAGSIKFGVAVSNTSTTPLIYKWMHLHGGITDTLKKDTTNLFTDTLSLTGIPLTDTGSYQASVVNSAGSATSLAGVLSIYTIPSAPTITSVKGASGQITVYWTTPANNGSAITSYKVTSVQDTSKHCTATTSDSCVVTGLSNTTLYSFTVVAINAAGASLPSTASTPTANIFGFSPKNGFALQMAGSTLLLRMPLISGNVHVSILDIWGRTIWSRTVSGDIGQLTWNGNSNRGSAAPTGVYLLRLTFQKGQGNPGGAIQTSFVRQ